MEAIDLSSILLTGENDKQESENNDGEKGPGYGVYSITVQSYNGAFIRCHNIIVDRSPNSTYKAPKGYKLLSTATSVSVGGVHIVENYVPQMMLDVDTMILLLGTNIDPTKDSASKIKFKSLTPTERSALYSGLNDVQKTFDTLLSVAGVNSGNVSYNLESTRCLKQLSFAFDVANIQQIDGLLRKRITPAVFMQIIYAGFGLTLLQTSLTGWTLTDTMAMISKASPREVSIENIASLRTSYDYKKMAKSTHITMNGQGQIVTSRIAGGDVSEIHEATSRENSMFNQQTPWANQSIATGSDVEKSAPALPLLRFATYKGVKITESTDKNGKVTATAKQEMDGDCLDGDGDIEAKVVAIPEKVSGFQSIPTASSKTKYDISSLSVKAKGKFAAFLHKMMTFENKLESAQLSTTFEGVILPAFSSFSMSDGSGSLQKSVISSASAEKEVETANVGTTGFIMSSTIIRSSGRTISMISYANMEDAFPLVFGKK